MTACVYYDTPPVNNFTVFFKAGASTDHCMNDRGQDNQTLVYRRGLSCAKLDYVELKGSSTGGDTCATDKSWWGTSYNGNGQSGSTNSRWYNGGSIQLYDQSPGTNVCGQEALCSATGQQWDGTGSLWVSTVDKSLRSTWNID